MHTRKKHTGKPTDLPTDFLKTVTELLNKQFQQERGTAEFQAYGSLYIDEVFLCVSLMEGQNLAAGTIYVSMDPPKGMTSKPERVTAQLQSMVDVVASWYSQCFEGSKEKGLSAVLEALRDQPNGWQDLVWEKKPLFVRVNKDNRALENAADRFLRDKGFEPDSDEFLVSEEEDESSSGRGPLN